MNKGKFQDTMKTLEKRVNKLEISHSPMKDNLHKTSNELSNCCASLEYLKAEVKDLKSYQENTKNTLER